MSPDEILNLFRNSTSAYDVCKKLNCKSYSKFVRDKIENVAKQYGFDKSQYKSKRKYCLNCGKILSNRSSKFCSLICLNEYKYKERINEWLNGYNPIIKGGHLSPYIKKYLMNKFNNKCELCGWGEINPVTGKVPLEVHHIDGIAIQLHLIIKH